MSLKAAVRPFKWGIDQAFMLTQPTTTLIFSNYPGGGKANATSVGFHCKTQKSVGARAPTLTTPLYCFTHKSLSHYDFNSNFLCYWLCISPNGHYRKKWQKKSKTNFVFCNVKHSKNEWMHQSRHEGSSLIQPKNLK